jgi:aspartate aminotransferase
LTSEEVEGIERVALDRNSIVLADESYDHIVFDGRPFVSMLQRPNLLDRLIYVNTFSKTWAMTGWRLGYIAGLGTKIKPAALIQRNVLSVVSSFVQRAGIAALGLGAEWYSEMLAEYTQRRDAAYEAVMASGKWTTRKPEGAFYLMARYDCSMSAREMQAFLMARGVGVRSGTEFGPSGEGYVRLSFAVDANRIREGVHRMTKAISELKAHPHG